MISAKGSYSRNVHILKEQAKKNYDLQTKLKAAKSRYRKHKSEMRPVDINEIVAKYAPGAKPYIEKYKIQYSNENYPYVVVADPSGYLRVMDHRVEGGFVDVFSGKTLTKEDKDFNKLTHFRIKRRDEK